MWGGPPGDLVAAAGQLITDEKEFESLFIQKPEDLKKKKKKKGDDGGIIQLVDGKRAMNAGIALAKLKVPFSAVVECLNGMTAKAGKYLLTAVEIQNLVLLCPTDEEVKLVKGFNGDKNRLGQVRRGGGKERGGEGERGEREGWDVAQVSPTSPHLHIAFLLASILALLLHCSARSSSWQWRMCLQARPGQQACPTSAALMRGSRRPGAGSSSSLQLCSR